MRKSFLQFEPAPRRGEPEVRHLLPCTALVVSDSCKCLASWRGMCRASLAWSCGLEMQTCRSFLEAEQAVSYHVVDRRDDPSGVNM